jgi:L-histidine N-alpha-methyltransferase
MTSLPVRVPERESDLLRDVRRGLARPQKEIPPKYFYDHRGSLLFEAITRLPEYYLTSAERRLLQRWMPSLMHAMRPAALVELGAGSGEKTRLILHAMRVAGSGRVYMPIDVSSEFLDASVSRLRNELPWLRVAPLVADFTEGIEHLLPRPRQEPYLFAFLGSTVGNLDAAETVNLLRTVRRAMQDTDRFLLGADLRTKPVERIERAYNDSAGLTADFNLNMLRVLNRELGADFHLARFRHRAFWSWSANRIEMHLESLEAQRVNIPRVGSVALRRGETIRTEICCKYDRRDLERLLGDADLTIETWRVDPRDQYALLVARTGGVGH